jgi:hypothetical protein
MTGKLNSGLLRIGLPATFVGAAIGVGGWMLVGVQGDGQALARSAAPRPAAAPRYDRVFGNIYYKVPPGYRAIQQENGVIMVPQADLAAGEAGAFLVISPGFPLTGEIKAKFEANGKATAVQAVAIAAGNLSEDPEFQISEPELANDPAKDGYESYVLASKSTDKDAGGVTRFSQYVVVLSGDRADVVMRIAYGAQEKYTALETGYRALLMSVEPRNSGAPAPTRLAAALPSDMTAITPKPKPRAPTQSASSGQPRQSQGGSCTYQQTCSYIGAGAYQTYSCLPIPVGC